MDITFPNVTNSIVSTNTPVFGDNVQDLLNAGLLNVNPTGIIVVNSIDDIPEQPGVTTLRDAINQANADPGEDLIVFDRSLFSSAQTITLNLGELDITHNLNIIAPKDELTGGDLVTVSGNNASRVFEIGTPATVSLDGLIVANGKVTGDNGGGILNSGILTLDNSIVRNDSATGIMVDAGNGGGIYNSGTLTVNNSTISGNSVTLNGGIGGNGGGIYNSSGSVEVNNSTISGNRANTLGGSGSGGGIYNSSGSVEVSNSTISDNNARVNGGGIYNANAGNLTVSNSTLGGNSAGSGGGIYNNGTSTVSNSTLNTNSAFLGAGIYNYNNSTLEVRNSTLSSNSALQQGGGIYNGGTLRLVFSTLTLNKAGMSGGGIYGTASVRNTIIALNLKDAVNINIDVSGTFSSNGYNLIGDSTGSTGFDQAIGDIVGTSNNPIDPGLDTLAFNGGSTQTIALLPGSPAISAADPIVLDTDPTTDQRGLPRRAADGSADIGAFQFS
ncbi:MAG: hypothetical protein DSM106950_19130 [Stigonema ocellatum SAG 48.90 = DSM 106950]|nr:hypothetical protein [Stigonema ocellatum SAG 48.90 = DSM 106950]